MKYILERMTDISINGTIVSEMTAKERNALPDDAFGIPSLRKFPLTDAKHVRLAMSYFNTCEEKYRKELALNILIACNKFGVKIHSKSEILGYIDFRSLPEDLQSVYQTVIVEGFGDTHNIFDKMSLYIIGEERYKKFCEKTGTTPTGMKLEESWSSILESLSTDEVVMEAVNSAKLPSITSTFIYAFLEKITNNGMLSRMEGVTKTGVSIDADKSLQINMLEMKNYKFPKKDEIINMVRTGDIELKFNPSINRLNSSIPVVLSSKNGKVIANVNLTNNAKDNGDGTYSIESMELYALLCNAYLYLKCYKQYSEMRFNYKMLEYGAQCYSRLFTSIFVRRHNINTTPDIYATVQYLSAKFYLVHMCGMMNNDACSNIAKKCCKDIRTSFAQSLDMKVQDVNFLTLDTFYKKLTEIVPSIAKTSLRDLLHDYVHNYGDTTLLAIEYLPSFMAMISNMAIGVYINKRNSIENIVSTYGENYFDLMFK